MKKILIISEIFAPENSIGAIRASKLAKYLSRKEEYEVSVLTAEKKYSVRDDLLLQGLDNVRICRVPLPAPSLYSKFVNKLRNSSSYNTSVRETVASANADHHDPTRKERIIKSVHDFAFFLLGYEEQCRYAKNAKKFIREHGMKADVVISTYGPDSSHMIGKYCKKHMKCKWIADFRDAVCSDMNTRFTNYIRMRDYKSCKKNADCLTAASEGAFRSMNTSLDSRVRVITNGYDSEDLQVINREWHEKLIFAYTGNLYYKKRDMSAFFRAVAQLIDEKVINAEKIAIQYAGSCFEQFQTQAQNYGVEYLVKDMGFCSRKESLQLQLNADALLLASWNNVGDEDIITGKFFEYLMCKKEIICTIVGNLENSLLKRIIEKNELGFCYEEINDRIDFASLKQFIQDLYCKKMAGEMKEPLQNDYARQFDYNELINKWIDVIEQ